MMVEKPAITCGSTQFDNADTLARDVHNNTLANNLPAISSPQTLSIQKSCFFLYCSKTIITT